MVSVTFKHGNITITHPVGARLQAEDLHTLRDLLRLSSDIRAFRPLRQQEQAGPDLFVEDLLRPGAPFSFVDGVQYLVVTENEMQDLADDVADLESQRSDVAGPSRGHRQNRAQPGAQPAAQQPAEQQPAQPHREAVAQLDWLVLRNSPTTYHYSELDFRQQCQIPETAEWALMQLRGAGGGGGWGTPFPNDDCCGGAGGYTVALKQIGEYRASRGGLGLLDVVVGEGGHPGILGGRAQPRRAPGMGGAGASRDRGWAPGAGGGMSAIYYGDTLLLAAGGGGGGGGGRAHGARVSHAFPGTPMGLQHLDEPPRGGAGGGLQGQASSAIMCPAFVAAFSSGGTQDTVGFGIGMEGRPGVVANWNQDRGGDAVHGGGGGGGYYGGGGGGFTLPSPQFNGGLLPGGGGSGYLGGNLTITWGFTKAGNYREPPCTDHRDMEPGIGRGGNGGQHQASRGGHGLVNIWFIHESEFLNCQGLAQRANNVETFLCNLLRAPLPAAPAGPL